jgi:hypothetical protein
MAAAIPAARPIDLPTSVKTSDIDSIVSPV